VLLLAATGCSSTPEQAAPAQAAADAAPYEGCTPSEFSLPWTQSSKTGRSAATLLEAAPTPPAKHGNLWRVEVEGGAITSAETYMPVHDHFGVPAPTVEPAGPSTSRLALDFMMRGPWQVRLNLASAEAGPDQVVFDVCVTE
jgi:hypothetical protein